MVFRMSARDALGAIDADPSREGCVARQHALRAALLERGLKAALIVQPSHITYLFGLYGWRAIPAAAVVGVDGDAVLAIGVSCPAEPETAKLVRYEDCRFTTLRDEREALAVAAVVECLPSAGRIGVDSHGQPFALRAREVAPIGDALTTLRRRKHPDEIARIERAVSATEAGYEAAAAIIRPGLIETDLFAAFLAAATRAAGEPIGELGSDFRGGAPGGRSRQMPLAEGDLLPLDAGAVVGGYTADLCRTFAVSGEFTPAQRDAFSAVRDALIFAKTIIRPGVSCRAVFRTLHQRLDGYRGWRFDHHLGHGIGLCAHEAPRLNPHWDDVFQEGDVFTLEPGLYGDDLRAGVRLEEDYALTSDGLRQLSSYPLDPQSAFGSPAARMNGQH